LKTTQANYVDLRIRVDQIADARGIIFTEKLKFVEQALECLQPGEILCVYCSDNHHKNEIPNWISELGHLFLGIMEENQYFKILIKKV
jgi:TusA-related sulfurtransferase